jgi:hypothetical protein
MKLRIKWFLDIIESNTKWLKLEQRIKWFVDIIEAYTKKGTNWNSASNGLWIL